MLLKLPVSSVYFAISVLRHQCTSSSVYLVISVLRSSRASLSVLQPLAESHTALHSWGTSLLVLQPLGNKPTVQCSSWAQGPAVPQVFPELYLPVMEEYNLRALRPWRAYLPSRAWLQCFHKMRQLNAYIKSLLRDRWRSRTAGSLPAKPDLLDRMLSSIEVSGASLSFPCYKERISGGHVRRTRHQRSCRIWGPIHETGEVCRETASKGGNPLEKYIRAWGKFPGPVRNLQGSWENTGARGTLPGPAEFSRKI